VKEAILRDDRFRSCYMASFSYGLFHIIFWNIYTIPSCHIWRPYVMAKALHVKRAQDMNNFTSRPRFVLAVWAIHFFEQKCSTEKVFEINWNSKKRFCKKIKSNLKWINSTFSRSGLWKSESEKLIENHHLSQLRLNTVLLTSPTSRSYDQFRLS